MKRAILSILVLLSFVFTQEVTAQTTEIDNGLTYLNSSQNIDGSWGSATTSTSKPAATAKINRNFQYTQSTPGADDGLCIL